MTPARWYITKEALREIKAEADKLLLEDKIPWHRAVAVASRLHRSNGLLVDRKFRKDFELWLLQKIALLGEKA